jgi:O-antigen/teichoic acid export membrane protein
MAGLASGEIPARLCGIVTVLFLARRSGVVLVGLYALAQSMTQYTYPFIDFGLRHVGARLMARYPAAGRQIMQQVQRRRVLMSVGIVPFLLAYAAWANLTVPEKVFLFLFSGISCLYAVSLEWAAWGKEHMRLVGAGRIIVPGSILLFLLLGSRSEHLLAWMVAGSAAGYSVQGLVFWAWWRRHRPSEGESAPLAEVREALAWRRTSIMGLAWFCNLAFNTIDMLMLGVMADAHQVGLYSAAYRTMNQVLFTYYLLIQVLYPRLARQEVAERGRALQFRVLLALFAAGSAIAVVLAVSGRSVLAIVFGKPFVPATLLLSILAWAIPLDFLTSYLSNAYFAWSMEKKVLLCTAIAAASNVVLNLIWIPAYGACAAAVNTLVSYLIFLASLAVAGWYSTQTSRAWKAAAGAGGTAIPGVPE